MLRCSKGSPPIFLKMLIGPKRIGEPFFRFKKGARKFAKFFPLFNFLDSFLGPKIRKSEMRIEIRRISQKVFEITGWVRISEQGKGIR